MLGPPDIHRRVDGNDWSVRASTRSIVRASSLHADDARNIRAMRGALPRPLSSRWKVGSAWPKHSVDTKRDVITPREYYGSVGEL